MQPTALNERKQKSACLGFLSIFPAFSNEEETTGIGI
jgi:hypothetical protein